MKASTKKRYAMKCEDAHREMNVWIDEELSPDRRTVFEHHLINCRHCSEQAEELRRLTALLNTRPPARPSAGLKKKTLSLFMEEAAPQGLADWWANIGWRMQGAMMASAFIGLGIGYQLGSGWSYAQQLSQYRIFGFLFSAGDFLSSWA